MIRNPILPPIKGYVEVEVDGKRKYKNIKTKEIVSFPEEEQHEEESELAERVAELEEELRAAKILLGVE